jgi:hypothetical protein
MNYDVARLRNPASLWALTLAMAVISGCGTTSKVRVDQSHAGLAQCQSIGWLGGANPSAGFTDQHIRSAALAALGAKGYATSADTPNCLITFALSSNPSYRPKPQLGIGLGGGSGGFGGGVGISLPLGNKNSTGVTLRLDVVDAGANTPLWSGWVDTKFAGGQPTEAESNAVVSKILQQFPNRVPPPAS